MVKVGDTVKRGQIIAEADGFVSASIHSSVSGKVKKIEARFTPRGNKSECIVIENDNDYTEVDFVKVDSIDGLSREDIINKVKAAGIVGMGGAGFPTSVKLSPKEADKIEYVIANCAECEPYITADYRRMLENPEELISGMKIVLKLFGNAKAIFGIEDNKMDCVEKLTELLKDEPKMEVMALHTKYPQGAEKSLIYATTKRKVTGLPSDVGCLVNNVETLIAIHHAVLEGRPVMERVFTISGDGINEPNNFKVLIGMNHNEIIEAAGGMKDNVVKIISGGPMMGVALFTSDIPITKTSSAFLAFTHDDVAEMEPTACINCGRCVDVCPSQIIPSRLANFSERGDCGQFEAWHGMDCVSCGCCSFVCPAKRHLQQSLAAMKNIVAANRRKK